MNNPLREIDFQKLERQFKKFQRDATLTEAEVIGASIAALKCWEQCAGRQFPAFHELLDSVIEAISPLGK